jgi:hypothetical protein
MRNRGNKDEVGFGLFFQRKAEVFGLSLVSAVSGTLIALANSRMSNVTADF